MSERSGKIKHVTEEEPDWEAVGKLLGAARRSLRLSKREAAVRAGFSEGLWRQLESGKRFVTGDLVLEPNPRDENLAAASRAVGLKPKEVFGLAGRARRAEDETFLLRTDESAEDLVAKIDRLSAERTARLRGYLDRLVEEQDYDRR